jgi:hypothetical protein
VSFFGFVNVSGKEANILNKGGMMKSKLFVLLAAILVASLVLGCAAPAPAPSPEGPAPSPAPSPEKPSPAPSPAPPGEKPASSELEQIIAKAKEEGEMVVVGSHGDDFATQLEGFKAKYPFITLKGLDLNSTKTVNRAVMEVKAGRVTMDVTEIGENGQYLLAGEGYLQEPEVEFPHLQDFEARFQPSSGLFVSFQISPRNQGA